MYGPENNPRDEDFFPDQCSYISMNTQCTLDRGHSGNHSNERGERELDTHKLGTCLRFANGQTCIGCGDKVNGIPLIELEHTAFNCKACGTVKCKQK